MAAKRSTADDTVYVKLDEARAFIRRCLQSVGTKTEHALQHANVLVAADYRGHYSHGINRLGLYVNDVRSGLTACDLEPVIITERAATANVDGRNLLGPVVGNFAMQVAIRKAREAGVGWVTAKGSNHYGIAGWYSMLALDHGLIGMSFTNTSPVMVPTRSKKPCLGASPISVAAPGIGGDSFVLDMATTAVALGKVEMADVRNERIPPGWGLDSDGRPTTDPKAVIDSYGLLPLGGQEDTGGYKGYGLSMMVEMFCSVLSGSTSGPDVRFWKNQTCEANLGQCFVAIDPEAFAPGFAERMQYLMNTCRQMDPAVEGRAVLVAGDPEREHMAECERRGGIPYHVNVIRKLNDLAAEIGVPKIVVN